MKYLLLMLASAPVIALAGTEYAVEIVCLMAMAAGAVRLLEYLDGDGEFSDGAH